MENATWMGGQEEQRIKEKKKKSKKELKNRKEIGNS